MRSRQWSRTCGPRVLFFFLPSFRGLGSRIRRALSPRGGLERYLVILPARVLPRHTLGQRPALPHPPEVQPDCAPLTPSLGPHSLQRLARGPSSRPPRRLGLRATSKSSSVKQSPRDGTCRADTANQHVRALRLPAPLAAVAAERRLAQRDHFIGQPEGVAHGQALAAGVHGRRARGARRRALRQKL